MPWNFKVNIKGPTGATGPTGPQGLPGGMATTDDAAVAAYISTVGTSATKTAVLARISENNAVILPTRATARSGAIAGARFISVGDSITESSSPTWPASNGSWLVHAALASKGSLLPVYNGGVGGANSADLQALIPTVMALSPSIIALMPGRNDSSSSPPTAMISLVTAYLAACRAADCQLVLVNASPQGTAALAAPTVTCTISTTTGGSNALGIIRYKVSVVNLAGETLPSAAASVTTVNTTSRIHVEWPHVPGSTGYKVFKETSIGSGTYALLATITASTPSYFATHRYVDTGSVTPSGSPAGANTTAVSLTLEAHAARRNAWLSVYAAANGIPLVDVYSLLVDPATGLWQTGYTFDGTHPTGEANAVIGQAVWAAVSSLVKPGKPILTKSATDPITIFPNGLFTTGGSTRPTGFTPTTTPSYESAFSVESNAARTGFLGNAYKIERTLGGILESVSADIATGFTVGDTIVFTAKMEMVGLAAGGAIGRVWLRSQDNTGLVTWSIADADYPPTTLTAELVIPSGVTALRLFLQVNGVGALYTGQVTIYNKTTQSYLIL